MNELNTWLNERKDKMRKADQIKPSHFIFSKDECPLQHLFDLFT